MPRSEFPHRTDFAQHPLVALAVSFALGIVLAHFSSWAVSAFLICGGACSLLALSCFTTKRNSAAVIFLMLAFLSVGAAFARIEKNSVEPNRVRRILDEGRVASGDPVEVTGVLARAPELAPGGCYLSLKVETILFKEIERNATGIVSLFAPARDKTTRDEYEKLELRHGARVRVMTALNRMDNFRNPGVSLLTDYLEQRGLDATGVVKSPLLIERLDDARVFLPLAWLYEWRRSLLTRFHHGFSRETAGVLDASLLGNRYFLSQSSAERFREGGTFHVLVISGLHISFIGLLALQLMRRVTRSRKWQFAAAVGLVWSYTVAVGAEASVVRAALMFTVVALGPVLHRRASSINALCFAGLVLLVWRPSDLFDPSFQLTFLSVLAIVALTWPVLTRLRSVGAWRPTRETPAPPVCPRWWRAVGEILFWDEKGWQDDLKHSPWKCRLFKNRFALQLQRLRLQTLARYVVSVVVVSVSVQIMLLPFLVLYFHRLSFASILLNIIVGALMALLSFCALATVVVSEFSSSIATPMVAITEAINWLMTHSVDPFESAKLASIRLPEYRGLASLVYGLFYLPLIVLTIRLARWNPFRHQSIQLRNRINLSTRVTLSVLLAAAVMIVLHPLSAPRPDGRLHIDFLDVGQGDSVLLTMPNGTTVLIDGGGRPDFESLRGSPEGLNSSETFERDSRSIGDAVVSEYLWWRGLDQVDYVVATHADADHMDGLSAIARNFKVGAALVAREPSSDKAYMLFARTMQREGVPVHVIGRSDSLRIGPVTIDVLWPLYAHRSGAPSRNDDSLVLRVRFDNRVFLFAGDIEHKAERALADTPEELRADVVKVAHHGSKTSSIDAFVNAARPSLAVISVGRSSIYGHPHGEVVERWLRAGARVLTTGQRGTISVSTNGHDLITETFVSSSGKDN